LEGWSVVSFPVGVLVGILSQIKPWALFGHYCFVSSRWRTQCPCEPSFDIWSPSCGGLLRWQECSPSLFSGPSADPAKGEFGIDG
jgi:hypothetical protein